MRFMFFGSLVLWFFGSFIDFITFSIFLFLVDFVDFVAKCI